MMTEHVKERPVLFSAPMVWAILEGKKSQTRRVIKPQPEVLFDIKDNSIEVLHVGYSSIEWRDIEEYPSLTERRLHGGLRRPDLLKDEICWLWEKGTRGLVSAFGASAEEGVSDRIALPQQYQGNEERSSSDLHGLPRDASEPNTSGAAFGRRSVKQPARESGMGDARGELAGPPRAWAGEYGGGPLGGAVYERGAGAYPLGDSTRAVQPEPRGSHPGSISGYYIRHCPYQRGIKLWVRETHRINPWIVNDPRMGPGTPGCVVYRADPHPSEYDEQKAWSPSIHMPRWASRITLEITEVRVERVQEISTADACAEGVPGCRDHLGNVHAVVYFKALWDSINRDRGFGWEVNPYVWVISFRRIEP